MTDATEAPTAPPIFEVTLEYRMELEVGDIWPDGDAPANPTSADVKALMESYGSATRLVSEWDLTLFDPEITVWSGGGGTVHVFDPFERRQRKAFEAFLPFAPWCVR